MIAISIDLCKAFDKVCHLKLVEKRKFYCRWETATSPDTIFLFLVYVNDLLDTIGIGEAYGYADNFQIVTISPVITQSEYTQTSELGALK